MYMSICEYLNMHVGAYGVQLRESDPIELEIQVTVS